MKWAPPIARAEGQAAMYAVRVFRSISILLAGVALAAYVRDAIHFADAVLGTGYFEQPDHFMTFADFWEGVSPASLAAFHDGMIDRYGDRLWDLVIWPCLSCPIGHLVLSVAAACLLPTLLLNLGRAMIDGLRALPWRRLSRFADRRWLLAIFDWAARSAVDGQLRNGPDKSGS